MAAEATAPAGSASRWAGAADAAQALFPIRVVSRLTGINPVTIRAWERRYGLVCPQRTPGGHRLYSRADLDRLRSASRLISQGVPISQAARLLNDGADGSGAEQVLEQFTERLRALDEQGMTALYEALRARSDGGAAAAGLLDRLPGLASSLPAMSRRVLESWLAMTLGARLQARLPSESGTRVLVCGSDDGVHHAWALSLALLLADAGLQPIVIGPVPGEELAAPGCAAVVLSGACDGLSAGTVPLFSGPWAADGGTPLAEHLPAAARQVVEALRSAGTPQ
ncbi:MAG: MerR family transcriptional regulator [Gammaproteobacteria bacterium]